MRHSWLTAPLVCSLRLVGGRTYEYADSSLIPDRPQRHLRLLLVARNDHRNPEQPVVFPMLKLFTGETMDEKLPFDVAFQSSARYDPLG